MENRTRKHQVHLDLSDDEWEILNRKCELSHSKSKMEFLRHMIIFGMVYTVDYSELQQYNWYLSNFSNNLNQIARVANETGSISQESINQAVKLMEEVWRLQKSMLSKQPFNPR